jgi:hypothetical protein
MALGSLALWTAVPATWLLLTRNLEPDTMRYVIAIAGCAITMLGAGILLYRLEAVYARARMTDTAGRARVRSVWLRSVGDEGGPRRPLTLLEIFLVVSAVVALVGLVGWWVFFAHSANPSGPLQPV